MEDGSVGAQRPCCGGPSRIGGNYSVSIFTSLVILRQVSICCASQVLASASELFGTMLNVCFLYAELASGVCSEATVASKIVCKICFGVPAGANKACQAIVPTPGKPASCMVGRS